MLGHGHTVVVDDGLDLVGAHGDELLVTDTSKA